MPPKCFKRVTHCIFDNDGTLMDTEHLYTTAVQNILRPHGKEYTYQAKMRYMGMQLQKASVRMVKDFELPMTPEEYAVKLEREISALISDVKLLPGVKCLLEHLFDHRVPMAIATSANRCTFNVKASPHRDLLSVFRHIVCGDDPELTASKPSPDIFLLAASRFPSKPQPECCLVFEDSPLGLEAGLAAGMQVVMVPDERVPIEITKGATLRLRSMAEFQPELFGLPPYDCVEKFRFG